MQNMSPGEPFRRRAVQPTLCVKSGWELIKDQYWLFVGMALITMILGSMVPFGILMGPMMCGVYLSLFQHRRGQRVEFGTLFRGFDYFGDSVVAALLHMIPVVLVLIPFYVVLYGGLFLLGASQPNREPDPASLIGFLAVIFVFVLVMMILMILISLIFTFAYPLIVDRKMSGLEAVKLSARAAMANFWPLLGLLLLNGLLGVGGMLLCYVGVFLAIPVTFAAIAIAYEQVFGLGEVPAPNLPPPPPSFT